MTLKEFIFDHGALSEHKHRHVVFPSDFQPFLLWSCDFWLNIKRVVKFRSDEGLTLQTSALKLCEMAYRCIINSVDKAKLSYVTLYRRSITVFLELVETYPLYSKFKKLTMTLFPTYNVSFWKNKKHWTVMCLALWLIRLHTLFWYLKKKNTWLSSLLVN